MGRVNCTIPQTLLDRVTKLERERFISVNLSLLLTVALEEWLAKQEVSSANLQR